MTKRSIIVAAAALVFAVPSAGIGQDLEIGPEINWGGDTDLGVGFRVVYGIEALPHWDFIGTFNIFFPDDGPNNDLSYWEINGNLAYNFVIEEVQSLFPYAGAGLNIGHVSNEFMSGGTTVDASSTDLGLNLFAGTRFNAGSLKPFAEVRYTIEGAADSQVVLTGGLLFSI